MSSVRGAGLPRSEMFAAADGLRKLAGTSTGSQPESLREASQEGLSNSIRSTSDRVSLGRFSGGQGLQSTFQVIRAAHEER